MNDFSWNAAYYSDLQSLWALFIAPVAFLAWRAAAPVDFARARVPEAARFVAGCTLFFAVATMIDPISTGPIARMPGIAGTWRATTILFFFVLLGDLRVLLLAVGVARPTKPLVENLRWALGAMLVVPVFAGATYFPLRALIEDLDGQVLWMLYEAGFFALCVAFSRDWLPGPFRAIAADDERRRYLRGLFGYSAAYYALWFAADVLIVSGLDLGWAIRIVPNQLYYAFWVPFAYATFFSDTRTHRGT